jgi:hypothetical protein
VAAGIEEDLPERLRHLVSFETGDALDLRRKLTEVLALGLDDRAELQVSARRAVERRWSWASVAERLLA